MTHWPRADLRFYGELKDFLSGVARPGWVTVFFTGEPAVKDLIESQGVPHPEVDLVLVHGESVEFGYRVQSGDRISVFPAFRSLEIAAVSLVRPAGEPPMRFLLDVHLGRLAELLRLLGFDAEYSNDAQDAVLAQQAAVENRILLTRDVGLLKRSLVRWGYYPRETDPEHQVREVLARFPHLQPAPLTRCARCNGMLEPVDLAAVRGRVPPRVAESQLEFRLCSRCGQVYWPGTHLIRLLTLLSTLTGRGAQETVPSTGHPIHGGSR